MKSIIAILLTTAIIGCSSTDDRIQMFMDSATACSSVCAQHPDVSEISNSAAGGIPILFLGGMEMTCRCKTNRRE